MTKGPSDFNDLVQLLGQKSATKVIVEACKHAKRPKDLYMGTNTHEEMEKRLEQCIRSYLSEQNNEHKYNTP